MTFDQLIKRMTRSTLTGGFRGLRVDDVSAYLDAGGDVNARTGDGQTLLHLAADNGEVDVIRLLAARGADVSARGYGGSTPLHLAVDVDCNTSARDGRRATELPLTALLLALGADESLRNDDDETPRDIAAAYGDGELALYDALTRPAAR